MRKIILTISILLLLASPVSAQKITSSKNSTKKETAIKSLAFSAPFIVTGAALYGAQGRKFQPLRDGISPGFSTRVDEYIQYSPLAMLYGLKIAGVEGRSSWGKTIVTNAISAAAMGAIVNGMKYTIKEPRPDGSRDNGYPSGHTALAFMSANMVHHEYGLTRSPWYSVAAYGLATTTAVLRVMNNAHYAQDVIMGAGIGILSTEFGYFVADLIYKDRGSLLGERNRTFGNTDSPYSYFGINMGYNKIFNTMKISGIDMESGWGTTASIDGAWYFNNMWGAGINASANNASTSLVNPVYYSSSVPGSIMGVTTPALNWYTVSAGPRISAKAGNILRFGAGLDLGYAYIKESSNVSFPLYSKGGLFLGGTLFAERDIIDGVLVRLFAKSDNSFFGNERPDISSLVLGWSVAINLNYR